MDEINELIEKVAEEFEAAGLDPSPEDLAEFALDKIAEEEPDNDDAGEDDVVKVAVDLASEYLPDDTSAEKIAEEASDIIKEALTVAIPSTEKEWLGIERAKRERRRQGLKSVGMGAGIGGGAGALAGGLGGKALMERFLRGKGKLPVGEKLPGKFRALGAGAGLLGGAALGAVPGAIHGRLKDIPSELPRRKKKGELLKSAAFENGIIDRSRQILVMSGFDPDTGERMSKVALARTPEEVKEAAALELLERRGWPVSWSPEYLARFQQEGENR